jgi:hypothetical protein
LSAVFRGSSEIYINASLFTPITEPHNSIVRQIQYPLDLFEKF